uniref:hypothetical protein n=1 Tax=Hymenobacter sp. AT01-02 TaxID=1571877 RepID=UPI000AC821A3
GPDGRYIITLTAATGQRVFRRELKKADFYRVAVPDMVVVSEPHPPRFLGYFPQLGGLAFWQDINIPNSDVGGYIFMLLDMQGELRELHFGNQFGEGRADCEPQPSPNGRALLTCSQLLRVGQPPLRLQKPQADIALARFLSDSTLLTIYSYGEYQMARAKDGTETMEFVVPNQLQRAPNAFVQTIQGRVLTSFRYQGFSVGMGYLVPRHYVWQNQTYYLLDEAKGLRLLNKQDPTLTQEVAFRQMSKFRAPRRPTEVRFRIENFEFYADKSHPAQVRYRRLTAAG